MHEEKEASKRPEDSDFKQQRLPAWQPLLTPKWVILTFFVVGAVFLPIGVVIVNSSEDVVELSRRYDHLEVSNDCTGNNLTSAADCSICLTFEVEEDMEQPVYLYYELSNYYQNHRRYVKSRSDLQLKGQTPDEKTLRKDCDPLARYGDAYGGQNHTLRGRYLYPCGLVANSFFTDTFGQAAVRPAGEAAFEPLQPGLEWRETGIAWPTDLGKKFGPDAGLDPARFTSTSPRGFELPPVEDEHFVVWMRSASEPTFAKLYARLPHTSLRRGDVLRLEVGNTFETDFFDGTKSVVLARTTWVGTADPFLGPAYLCYAFIFFALGGCFVWRARHIEAELARQNRCHMPFTRPFGDEARRGAPSASVLEAAI